MTRSTMTNELELTNLIIAPALCLEEVSVKEKLLDAGGKAQAWSVSEARGKIQGVGTSVSGRGAYASLEGSMKFSTITLETSKTYQEMKESYRISSGTRGFWSWIGLESHASSHKEELTKVFNELSQSQKTEGEIKIKMYVTGLYPNVPVNASAYIQAFQVSSKTETDVFSVISTEAPTQDTGAQDQNGHNLPTKNNESSFDF